MKIKISKKRLVEGIIKRKSQMGMEPPKKKVFPPRPKPPQQKPPQQKPRRASAPPREPRKK